MIIQSEINGIQVGCLVNKLLISLLIIQSEKLNSTFKKKAGINIDEIMDVTQYACFSSSHQIILLGCKDEHQGIYTYDIDSGKTELLYESKNELINSFELLE